jgi:hypothetical protein
MDLWAEASELSQALQEAGLGALSERLREAMAGSFSGSELLDRIGSALRDEIIPGLSTGPLKNRATAMVQEVGEQWPRANGGEH